MDSGSESQSEDQNEYRINTENIQFGARERSLSNAGFYFFHNKSQIVMLIS